MAAPSSSKTGLFYQPSGKCAEREGGGGDSEEVSESNEAIVPAADQTPTLQRPRLLATKAVIGRAGAAR